MVYPDHWWPELPLLPSGLPPQVTRGTRLLFEELERRQVRTLNLTPAFLLARKHSRLGHPRQFTHDGKDDSHWTYYGAALSAHVLAREIERLPWYPALPKLEGLAARWVRRTDEEPPGDDARTLRWERRITGLPRPEEQARAWRDAPILVLGDSHLDSRYGFASQLAYELRVPVQTLGREGDGPGLALEAARRDPDWWLAKELIVQLFANRAYARPLDAKGDLTIFPEGLEATRARARLLAGGSARLTLRATLEAVSTARSPEEWAPYTSALIHLRFRVDHVFGDGVVPVNPDEVIGVGWGLVDAQPTWLTTAEPGTRYVLNLEALALHEELLEVGADTDAVEDLLMPPYLIKAMRNLDDGSQQRPLPRGPKR